MGDFLTEGDPSSPSVLRAWAGKENLRLTLKENGISWMDRGLRGGDNQNLNNQNTSRQVVTRECDFLVYELEVPAHFQVSHTSSSVICFVVHVSLVAQTRHTYALDEQIV